MRPSRYEHERGRIGPLSQRERAGVRENGHEVQRMPRFTKAVGRARSVLSAPLGRADDPPVHWGQARPTFGLPANVMSERLFRMA